MDNPFTMLRDLIDGAEQRTAKLIAELHAKFEQSQKAPEFETLSEAARRRKKARETIMAKVDSGEIRKRDAIGRGGKPIYLLSVPDLDRLFPAHAA